MKNLIIGVLLLSSFAACSSKTGEAISKKKLFAHLTPIQASLDLSNVDNDKVWVEIDPGVFVEDTITYRLPRVVQGTYDISNFGSFIEGLVAYNYSGELVEIEKLDANTWIIPKAQTIDKLGYYVNDTFDIENTETPTPFSPSGTNIEPDNFILNLHGFIGYFEELDDSEYNIKITSPASFEKASAIPLVSSSFSKDSSMVTDTYFADRYFEVTDNPMMYGEIDVEEFMVGDIEIVLSVYSPTLEFSAADIKDTVYEMMEAQKVYLGDLNSTKSYHIFLYLPTRDQGQARGFGALEHHTSTVVVLPEWISKEMLDESMIDVVSHEFFHIVTPLSVHSEDVHYFDYNEPTFSKHLWMYEGVTEYFASHFQVYEGLQSKEQFYDKILEKIYTASNLDDEMSFTIMSENVIDEPYATNYYNVYMKGALIGMCLDIILREESSGERSMLSLMKELSDKYGIDKPFNDNDLIEEITEMTYTSIGEFLETHVVGTTPINYDEYFNKVGLEVIDESPTSFFFVNENIPFIDATEEGKFYFRDVELNSTHKELGIESGDIIKSVNGEEYTIDNAQSLIVASFGWTSETDISLVVIRGDEEIEISGKVGNPTVYYPRLMESENATEAQLQLRKFWLEK